jgi:hypothetical protein
METSDEIHVGKYLPYPLCKRLGGRKIFLGRPAHSLVAISTEVARLPCATSEYLETQASLKVTHDYVR